jgi:uncharacterized protein YecE (DUF72 family)
LTRTSIASLYAEHFNLVEVNSTFYAVPDLKVVKRWCAETPEDFVFDVKLHRLFSRHSTQVKLLPRGIRRLAGAIEKAKPTPKLETALARVYYELLDA